MQISSPEFKDQSQIPQRFTCQGEDINPELLFSEIPSNAESLALILDDPDAPSGTFVHWVLWNIDPMIDKIAENSVPDEATHGKNSAGSLDYMGPCPPSGTHRYIFKLYALDIKINLPEGSNAQDLEKAIKGHIIDQAELVGLYTNS